MSLGGLEELDPGALQPLGRLVGVGHRQLAPERLDGGEQVGPVGEGAKGLELGHSPLELGLVGLEGVALLAQL